jgi:adenosylmethionine-8-amino-7-oxononanoate aminotransferase
MNIHEYQAKAVLKEFGVPVSRGVPVLDAAQAEAAAKELGGPLWVVKSQIHAGGRGKGKFKEASAGEKGGVRLAKSIDEVKTFFHGHTYTGNPLACAVALEEQVVSSAHVVNLLHRAAAVGGVGLLTLLQLKVLVDLHLPVVAVVAVERGQPIAVVVVVAVVLVVVELTAVPAALAHLHRKAAAALVVVVRTQNQAIRAALVERAALVAHLGPAAIMQRHPLQLMVLLLEAALVVAL